MKVKDFIKELSKLEQEKEFFVLYDRCEFEEPDPIDFCEEKDCYYILAE